MRKNRYSNPQLENHLTNQEKNQSFDATEPTRRSRTPLVCSVIDPLSYLFDDSQIFRPMCDKNLTQSPCFHHSGTHDFPTTESRYNFIQVLIFSLFKCEARKADDAVRAREIHRAGAVVQQQCSIHGDVAAYAIAARCEDLVAEERI